MATYERLYGHGEWVNGKGYGTPAGPWSEPDDPSELVHALPSGRLFPVTGLPWEYPPAIWELFPDGPPEAD